jgi:hypothetical protein
MSVGSDFSVPVFVKFMATKKVRQLIFSYPFFCWIRNLRFGIWDGKKDRSLVSNSDSGDKKF